MLCRCCFERSSRSLRSGRLEGSWFCSLINSPENRCLCCSQRVILFGRRTPKGLVLCSRRESARNEPSAKAEKGHSLTFCPVSQQPPFGGDTAQKALYAFFVFLSVFV